MTGAISLLYYFGGCSALAAARSGPSIVANTSTPPLGNFSFYEGEDYIQPFTVKDVSGVVVDISSYSLTLTVRSHFDSTGSALVTKTAAIVSGAAGTCKVTFARADTVGLEPKSYSYDLSRTDAGADSCLVLGYLNLLDRAR